MKDTGPAWMLLVMLVGSALIPFFILICLFLLGVFAAGFWLPELWMSWNRRKIKRPDYAEIERLERELGMTDE